jgi:hypothetical protein
MKQAFRGLLLASSVMLGLTGCPRLPGDDTGLISGIIVHNSTAIELHFRTMVDGEWFELGTARPFEDALLIQGGEFSVSGRLLTNDCTTSDLVAYTPDGAEFARQPPPVCLSGRVAWTIEEAAPSP